tara:strand:+ start:163 stop:438 length:276 start_codon:yes stop_codon:yes gene_type:complete
MDKKRDRLQILHDILRAIQEKGPKAKPTHVLYKSNLSYTILNGHLAHLMEKEFILEEEEAEGKRTYSLTDKGFKFLADYQVVRNFVESYGL